MALSTVYWIALGSGLGLLTLSVVLGEVFDAIDLEIAGADLHVVPVFFAATSAFGAGGLLGLAFGLQTAGSVISGAGVGLAVGFLTAVFFALLHRQQAQGSFQLSDLVGTRGRCTLAIEPGQTGRVSIAYEGMTRALVATSSDEVQPGDEVIVSDVVGSTLRVVKPGTLGLSK